MKVGRSGGKRGRPRWKEPEKISQNFRLSGVVYVSDHTKGLCCNYVVVQFVHEHVDPVNISNMNKESKAYLNSFLFSTAEFATQSRDS